jgi:hypothetical protein
MVDVVKKLVSTGVDYGDPIALDAVGDSCLLKKYGDCIHSPCARVFVETDNEIKHDYPRRPADRRLSAPLCKRHRDGRRRSRCRPG